MKVIKKTLGYIFVILIVSSIQNTSTIYAQTESPLRDQRILLIGDSQVAGTFGSYLSVHAAANGATRFIRVGRQGWGVAQWESNGNRVKQLIEQHRPTLILVALGGNDYNRSGRPDYALAVENLWNFIRENADVANTTKMNTKYCWISPATAVGNSRHTQPGRIRAARIIRSVISERYYVESFDITGRRGRTSDGLHFTHSGGNNWARHIIPRLEQCVRNQ